MIIDNYSLIYGIMKQKLPSQHNFNQFAYWFHAIVASKGSPLDRMIHNKCYRWISEYETRLTFFVCGVRKRKKEPNSWKVKKTCRKIGTGLCDESFAASFHSQACTWFLVLYVVRICIYVNRHMLLNGNRRNFIVALKLSNDSHNFFLFLRWRLKNREIARVLGLAPTMFWYIKIFSYFCRNFSKHYKETCMFEVNKTSNH